MPSKAEQLTRAAEAARKAGERDEPRLDAAYLSQLRNALAQAVTRYKAIAGLGMAASADWTPPSVADVLDVQIRTARIRAAQRAMMGRLAGTYSEIPGVSFDVTHPMTQDILDGLGARAEDLGAMLREPVAAAIAQGWAQGLSVPDTAKLINRSTKGQLAGKATMLARTDLIGMSNGAAQGTARLLNDAAKQANEDPPIGTKVWLSSHDGRVRDTHAAADGQRVPIDLPYTVGGEPLMYPGDPSGSNAETINCRCTELYDEPVKKLTPKEEAVMDGRSDLINDMLGPHVDTRAKYMANGVYTQERHDLHRRIAEEFLAEGRTAAEGVRPTATFMAGGSGAGKSTVVRTLQEEGRFPSHAVKIDPDAIKERLPEYQRAVEARDKLGARIAHEESSDIAKMILDEANQRRMNVVIDGTGNSEPGKFLGKLVSQHDAGYDVDVVMVDVPTDVAVERAAARAARTGRYVPEKIVRQIHGDVAARFEEWKDSPAVRSWQLWDNTERPPRLAARRVAVQEGEVVVHPQFPEIRAAVVRKEDEILDRRLYREFLYKGGKPRPLPVKDFLDERQFRGVMFGDRKGRAAALDAKRFLDELVDPEALGEAQDRIEKVTNERTLPLINLTEEGSTLGQYRSLGRTPINLSVKIAEANPHPGETLTHEFGHVLDHQALGNGRFLTELDPGDRPALPAGAAMNAFTKAAAETPTMKKFSAALRTRKITLLSEQLERDPLLFDLSDQQIAFVEYAIADVEVWARAFSQWVATHPKAPAGLRQEMLDTIRKETSYNPESPYAIDLPLQWPAAEFEKLAPLIEDVLRQAEVLRVDVDGSLAHAVDVRLPARLEVGEPLAGVLLSPAVPAGDLGDDLVLGEPVLAHEVDGDERHPGNGTGRVGLSSVHAGRGRGGSVRRRRLGRQAGAAAVRDPGGTEGVSGRVEVRPDLRGFAREGARTRTLTTRTARLTASSPPEAAVRFQGELPPEGRPMAVMPAPTSLFAAAAAPVDEETALGAAWQSDVVFEGLSTGDGRFIVPGALSWREPPLTLMAMVETTEGGHLGAEVSGRMDAFEKKKTAMDGSRLPDGVTSVYSTGFFDVGEYGRDIERMVGGGVLSGISVDLSIQDWAFRDPETGEIIDPETATDEQWEKAFLGEYELAMLDATIMAATVCPTPAFADAKIALLASASSHFGHTWRANAYAAQAFGIEVGQLCTTIHAPLSLVEVDSMTASAGFPVKPPRDFFFTPEADGPVPLTFKKDGRVFGHLAPKNACHTGYINGAWSQCVTPPRSKTDYSYFHVGEIPTADGDNVAVGKIMLGEMHAPGGGSREQARGFYDRTGRVGCYVRATDGKHGIWLSGAVKEDLTDAQWRDLNANPPSGDWRAVDGNLELIAAIAVPVPGYPIPRAKLSLAASADGEMIVESLILTADWDALDTFEADALAVLIEDGTDGLDALIQNDE